MKHQGMSQEFWGRSQYTRRYDVYGDVKVKSRQENVPQEVKADALTFDSTLDPKLSLTG